MPEQAETPSKSIYSKFPFLKSTPTKTENLLEIEHSGLLASSSLGFHTFKNEYLEFDDPMVNNSPSSNRNSELDDYEERIDSLQERVDLHELEIQDLQKQLADALNAVRVRDAMLDEGDLNIQELSEKVEEFKITVEELKNTITEKNQEITRLDFNFRQERAQFHSDMEHLHTENANLIKDLASNSSDLGVRYQEALESNKELTELIQELSKPKVDAESQYEVEIMDIGVQAVVNHKEYAVQAVVDQVMNGTQMEPILVVVNNLTSISTQTEILTETMVESHTTPNPNTTKIPAFTQSDFIQEQDQDSFIKSKSFLAMEEISELWEDPPLKTQLDEIVKSTMATRGYLIEREHTDKEIYRWIESVKKEVGENECLIKRVGDGLEKEKERAQLLREEIEKYVKRSGEELVVEIKEVVEVGTQTVSFMEKSADGGAVCELVHQNQPQFYQAPIPVQDQKVVLQETEPEQKYSRPFSMLFSVGIVIAAYISWQANGFYPPRKNITLI